MGNKIQIGSTKQGRTSCFPKHFPNPKRKTKARSGQNDSVHELSSSVANWAHYGALRSQGEH